MKRPEVEGEKSEESRTSKSVNDESHHKFMNQALSFTLLENLFKPLSPILELVCAGLFAGGTWGRYKFYESFIYLAFRISLMGMDKGVIWYYSQVSEKIYLNALFRSVSWCLLAFSILGFITFGSYQGWIPHSNWVLGSSSESFNVSTFELLAYLMVIPMMVISEICIQANVNKMNLKYRIIVPGIVVPLFIFGSAIVIHCASSNSISLAYCLLFGNCVGALLAVWGFFRTHRPHWSDISFKPNPPWKLLKYSFPLASANVFTALAGRVDIFMLASLSGIQSLEVYSVVCMIGKSLISIRQSFDNILLSTFSTSAKNELSIKLKHYFNYSIWMVMAIQSVFLAFGLLFGSECLGLVSSQYVSGYWVLIATAGFIYINTVTDFTAILTLGLGRTAIVPFFQVAFLAINIGLNTLFIPRWDALGAAFAIGLANFSTGLLLLGFINYSLKIFPLILEYWISIITGTLIFGIPILAVLYFDFGFAWKTGTFIICLAIVYIVQKNWYNRLNRILKQVS